MSLTQWFTRSWPMVSWRPAICATFSFVPTPSALETSSGSLESVGTRNSPPNPPGLETTCAVAVLLTRSRMRCLASRAASRSTPASRYVVGVLTWRSSDFCGGKADVVECCQVAEARDAILNFVRGHVPQPVDAEL